MYILILILIASLHVFVLSKLIFFPYPELFVYPYLTKIGLLPYKEIFDQHFPGIMFFPINLATLGIDTPEEMRIVQYCLVLFTHIVLFGVSSLLLKSNKKAPLCNLIYFLWQPIYEGHVLWIDSFVAPILLSSFYFLTRFFNFKKTWELFVTGLLFGMSLLFKQVVLPLVFFVVIFLWFKYRKLKFLTIFLTGLAVPIFFLIYYGFSKEIYNELFYWTITFNLTIFAEMGRTLPSFRNILFIAPVFGFSVFILLYFFKRRKIDLNLISIGVFLIGALFFAFARFDLVHLQPALPFAIIAIVMFVFKGRGGIKMLGVLVFIVLTLLTVAKEYKFLVGSRVLFYGEEEKIISEAVKMHVHKNDAVFAFGTFPHIYQMTETVPPGKVFVFQFPWFMLKAEDVVLEGIKKDPPKVVIRDLNSEVAGVNLTKYMAKINKYIGETYVTLEKVGDVEIMLPK